MICHDEQSGSIQMVDVYATHWMTFQVKFTFLCLLAPGADAALPRLWNTCNGLTMKTSPGSPKQALSCRIHIHWNSIGMHRQISLTFKAKWGTHAGGRGRSLWMTRLVILSSRISRISILFTHCFSSTFSLPSYSVSLINFISLDQKMQTHINNTCLSKVFLFRNVQRPVRRQGSTRESWKHTIHFLISPEMNPVNPTVRLGCRLEHVSHSALDCEQLPRKKLDKPLQIWSQGGKRGCSEKSHIGENLPDLGRDANSDALGLWCGVGGASFDLTHVFPSLP